jgi:hypothetical protein
MYLEMFLDVSRSALIVGIEGMPTFIAPATRLVPLAALATELLVPALLKLPPLLNC